MSTFFIDPINGSDANDGSSFVLAWKTVTSGATEARIAPGDTIKIKSTPSVDSGTHATFTPGITGWARIEFMATINPYRTGILLDDISIEEV